MSDYGRETVVFFEIDQPLCQKTYGQTTAAGTCAAVLGELGGAAGSPPAAVTGNHKCYNTRATCQDSANYSPGVLTLRFAMEQVDLLQYGYVLPMLMDAPNTTPAAINLAAMDRKSSALGQREVITVNLVDAKHSDHRVDPYRLERGVPVGSPPIFPIFDPYERGTFWGKWLARNPYHSNYKCRVREGFLGQALGEMRVRHYIIDHIEGPTDGTVAVIAKDAFSKIEAKKALAPSASRGELLAGITAAAGITATLNPTGIGDLDYPGNGSPEDLYVRIGDEIIRCTRAGDVLTLVERGAFLTEVSTHDAQDVVQHVLSYVGQRAHNIVYDLFVNYSHIDTASIDKTDWDMRAEPLTALYTAHIAEPTPVADLIGELSEQAGFTVWPDVVTDAIRFAPLQATTPTANVDDDRWIIDGSLSLKRQDAKRVSQVHVYYGQIDPTQKLDERKNYRSRIITPDLDAEDDTQYGTPAIREVFSRWIPQFGRQFAQEAGERILAIFRDPPLEAHFSVAAARNDDFDLTQFFNLTTAEVQDDTGDQDMRTYAAVEIARGENQLDIVGQQITFATLPTDDGNREIIIENDSFNVNLRSIFDTLFSLPDPGSPSPNIRFIVLEDVVVGSAFTSTPAMRTGSWPAGVNLILENRGLIEGKGGAGGSGAGAAVETAGETGGDAIQADSALIVDNTLGRIWGGGGGGGGGGGAIGGIAGGGGGGGGAGTDPGIGGAIDLNNAILAGPGADGTFDAGGAAGAGAVNGANTGGNGGVGGGPGLPGLAGGGGSGGAITPGAAGGSAGRYVIGASLVTWIGGSPDGDRGDVRGGTA